MVAVYTCQDGCNVTNDKTNFNCLYPDGKSCGNAAVDIFVSQTAGTKITSNTQPKSEPVSARSATVTARAAKKTTPKPNAGNKPTGPDKAAGGDVYIRCPNGCSLECSSVEQGQSSICVCKRGSAICEEEVTQIGAPQSF